MIKVGDLVEFYSTFEPFNADYAKLSPGIVLDVRDSWPAMSSYVVLWKDGSVTTEREGYLQIVEE